MAKISLKSLIPCKIRKLTEKLSEVFSGAVNNT
jgi:hypothetical protein